MSNLTDQLGTDNLQLDAWLRRLLKHYPDVAYRPTGNVHTHRPSIKRNYAIVLNTDQPTNPGTHWVALVHHNQSFYYFDSYGLNPPQRIKDHIRRLGEPLYYNTSIYQRIGSTICGELSLRFIKHFLDSKSFPYALSHFTEQSLVI